MIGLSRVCSLASTNFDRITIHTKEGNKDGAPVRRAQLARIFRRTAGLWMKTEAREHAVQTRCWYMISRKGKQAINNRSRRAQLCSAALALDYMAHVPRSAAATSACFVLIDQWTFIAVIAPHGKRMITSASSVLATVIVRPMTCVRAVPLSSPIAARCLPRASRAQQGAALRLF